MGTRARRHRSDAAAPGAVWLLGIASSALLAAGCATSPPVLLDSYSWQTPVFGLASSGGPAFRLGGAPLEMCADQPTPWSTGERCGPNAVLQPQLGRCAIYSDVTPRLDPVQGHYRAEYDRRNWIDPVAGGVLEVVQVYMLDNGEGDERPHGPHGNIYWDIFGAFEPVMQSADGAAQRRLASPRVLRGPHRTHDKNDEWLDDEALSYRGAGLHRWGSRAGTEDAIVLRIWESDGSEDGFLGRRNDVLGMEHIRREDTERPCGVWVPFHRYRNSHPRQRTSQVMLWMWLRTTQPPPAAERWARLPTAPSRAASAAAERDSSPESARTGGPWTPPTAVK